MYGVCAYATGMNTCRNVYRQTHMNQYVYVYFSMHLCIYVCI